MMGTEMRTMTTQNSERPLWAGNMYTSMVAGLSDEGLLALGEEVVDHDGDD